MDEYLTTKEIASILKVHVLTVRRWIENKKLVAIKLGKDYRIKKRDFENFISERSTDQ